MLGEGHTDRHAAHGDTRDTFTHNAMSSDEPPELIRPSRGERALARTIASMGAAMSGADRREAAARRPGKRPKGRERPTPKRSARELLRMADDARQGTPPATSPARTLIDEAALAGDFERARTLTEEVKERAPDLDRLAAAQAKRERRAARARGDA